MIEIRVPDMQDESMFLRAMDDSVALHSPWVRPPRTSVEFREYIERYNQPNHVSYLLLKQDKLAGVININEIIMGAFKSAFLGFYAVVGAARTGLMSEGLKAVLHRAKYDLELHRLEANIQPDNIASINFIRKNGFIKEGFSSKYLYIDGAWRDHERWALLLETR